MCNKISAYANILLAGLKNNKKKISKAPTDLSTLDFQRVLAYFQRSENNTGKKRGKQPKNTKNGLKTQEKAHFGYFKKAEKKSC